MTAGSSTEAQPQSPRCARIAGVLRQEFARLYGIAAEQVEPGQTFLAMGADSLMLLRASRFVRDQFGVRVPFRRLLDDLGTLNALAAHLDGEIAPESAPASVQDPAPFLSDQPAAALSASPATAFIGTSKIHSVDTASRSELSVDSTVTLPTEPAAPSHGAAGALERVVAQQIQLMSEQLAALRAVRAGAGQAPTTATLPPPPQDRAAVAPASPAASAVESDPASAAATDRTGVGSPAGAEAAARPTAPAGDDDAEMAVALDEAQAAHVAGLVARMAERTKESKRRAAEGGDRVVDPARAVGFAAAWKEALHPLAIRAAAGGTVVDEDGNDYVDLEMGGGALWLGHTPTLVAQAIAAAVERGMSLDGDAGLRGEVAGLLCGLTGAERVAFAPSHGEAVAAALRLARTVTEREAVAVFAGGRHGDGDGVLGRRSAVGGASVPAAPGVPAGAVQPLLVVEPDDAGIASLRAHASRLAAVLVDASLIASQPDPAALLRSIAELCEDVGAALVVDETASLPLLHAGGVAALHGVQADLVVVGSAAAGGAPFAAVAGRAAYLDPADGGAWAFGDDSEPWVETTPLPGGGRCSGLGLAAARAVLAHLAGDGAGEARELSRRAQSLAAELRGALGGAESPVSVEAAGPRIVLAPRAGGRATAAVLRLHLRESGVHVPADGVCHLSVAHTEDDLDRVLVAVRRAVREMRRGGFAWPGAAEAEAITLPLTPGQRELWLVAHISEEGARAYNEPVALRIRGPFDVAAMRAALREVVARHQALRTRFAADGETQCAEPWVELAVPLLDLAHLSGDEAEAGLAAAVEEEAGAVFDLSVAPLIRARLVRLGAEDHALVYVVHHAVTDGWSNATLLDEIRVLYRARVHSRPHDLPEPGAYADAVRARLHAEGGDAPALEYWRGVLADPPVLELPTDRPRPAMQTFTGGRKRHVLDASLVRRLAAFAEARGTTTYAVLFAAFQVLLHRLTGQDDVVAATLSAGQAWDDAAPAVGYFTDLVPQRSRLAGDPDFATFVGSAHARLLDAMEHRGVPVSRLIEALELPRGASRPALAAAAFTWLRGYDGVMRLGDALAERHEVRTGTARFDLSVTAVETAEHTRLEAAYDADLLDGATVARWMAHLETLLHAAIERPATSVRDLPLMDAAGLARELEAWNPPVAAPAVTLLHAELERQAAETPDAVALETEDGTVTYAELEQRAGRVARALRAAGVGPDCVVGLAAERSAGMVVGMLGILKAGAAWLPLDPTLPPDRLAFMVEDARPRAVLAQSGAAASLPDVAVPILTLEDAEQDASRDAETLACGADGDSLAYVIYTSGSTGRPKGVMIPHRGISNRVAWVRDTYPMGADDAVLFKTPYTFDASVWEVFLPLWTGGRVVVAKPGGHQDPAYLVETVARRKVTTLQLVPSMLQVVAAQPGLERCTALRRLSCGGEAYPTSLAREVARRLPSVELINLYGPTEASIDVASWRVTGGEDGALLPIGTPVHNTRIYLLDDCLRPVPQGVAGELYADGPGLARGYLARPAMTAERFVPDPFAATAGARMYRTGDRARRRADGALEFLGRADQQVKVRGFRIELGEIESALAAHPEVASAVAAVRDTAGGPALVGYVVSRNGSPPTGAELRAHLSRRLPEYMVPAAFVTLDELPRTPGGKVDRNALPAPRAAGFAARTGYVPPRSALEGVLADLWTEVLKCGAVGVHDRFFDLGGHSLTVLQLLARVRAVLAVEVPLRALFDDPTVAGLAAAVERLRAEGSPVQAPPLVPIPGDGPRALSFAQQRLWLLHQIEPESPAYNLYSAFPFPTGAEAPALQGALTELVRRHSALRTVFPEGEGAGVQQVQPAAPVPLAVADFAGIADHGERWAAAAEAARQEVLRPFDLAAGPLVRATLVRLGEDGDRLVLVMHHAVSDGWSMDVIRDELAVLYEAGVRGEAATLPPLPVQYADHAEWERAWLRGDALEEQLAYWRAALAGAPPVIALPADRPRPAVQTYRGDTRRIRLTPELTDAVRRMGSAASATPFMTLLAAFKAVLHRWGAGSDVVVGTHVANRDRVEVERLVGFFVNALVLRTDLSGDPPFAEALRRVRETALGAFARAHVPFERLVEELQPERDLGRTPLYQVSFDFQRVERGADGPRLLTESPTAKFDLEVTALEVEDEMQVHVSFSTDLFDAATIERMLRHLSALLSAASADPATRLSALPLLDADESARLAGEFQGPRRDYPLDRTLPHLIAAQAERTPDAVAVVHGGERATYAEVEARSNRMARLLRSLGAARGDRVALMEERGVGFIAAVVGVMKAGAAYVPLDPTYPADRLRHMLADSGARVLVTRADLVAGMACVLDDARALEALVLVDGEADGVQADVAVRLRVAGRWELDRQPGDALAGPGPHPRDPAYMLYTSGSTGLPKGAVVRHDGAVNHVLAEREVLGLDADLRFLQSAPASSDISVWQMLAPLALGGRSVVVDADTVADPERLFSVLRDERVTLFEPVPAVMRGVLEHAAALPDEARALPALRQVMATGEAVPADLVNAWLAAYPATVVVNAYGPTETSDDVTQIAITEPLSEDAADVPIGRPIPNLECWVVDEAMGLVPLGVPGELCIGGVAVGDGYPGHPARTAAAFVPDPFGAAPGVTLYRTGDRVRWMPDGTLRFMGRIDQQVKLRGYRVEPGEIEAALREHPAVADCAVVLRRRGGGDELAAFVVAPDSAERAESADGTALREHLRGRLPEHMVPAAFVRVDALPLTPAGKVDRRVLAADASEGLVSAEPHVAPRTPTEEALVGIWAEVLGRGQVSVEADFFELGGHSLLAAMVAARVRRALGTDLPLRRVFENTTVARLAAWLDAARAEGPAGEIPRLARVARSGRRVADVADGILRSL